MEQMIEEYGITVVLLMVGIAVLKGLALVLEAI